MHWRTALTGYSSFVRDEATANAIANATDEPEEADDLALDDAAAPALTADDLALAETVLDAAMTVCSSWCFFAG